MQAIIEAKGHQYRVQAGDLITVPRLSGRPGDVVELGKVLFIIEKEQIVQPREKIQVQARVVRQFRGKKIRVLRYRRRKNWIRTHGHRTDWTAVKIEKIERG